MPTETDRAMSEAEVLAEVPQLTDAYRDPTGLAPWFIREIITSLAAERRTVRELRDMLIDCLLQWGYEGTKSGVPVLSSGGLSTLEEVLRVLGLPDPCPVAEAEAFARRIRARGDDGGAHDG